MKIIADVAIPYLDLFFSHKAEIIYLPGRQITKQSLQDADALIIRSITPINAALLESSRIKWVASLTAGTDHMDTDWLDAREMAWCAAPGFNAPPVADYVVSVLAALIQAPLLALNAKRAAVIGVGHVGHLVAQRLMTLGFDVLLVDPLREVNESDFQGIALHDVRDVDLICLHTPLTKQGEHATYHMINADFLRRQKPGCVILNASRGAVLDTQALMTHGKHLVTCLDVFEHEPQIDLAILKKAFITTPHIAGHSIESKYRGVRQLYEWAVTHGLFPKIAIKEHIPLHTLTLTSQETSWHAVVRHVFDVLKLSNDMQHAILSSSQSVATAFDDIRRLNGSRHEFAYTSLMQTEKLPQHDRLMLQSIGFSFLG